MTTKQTDVEAPGGAEPSENTPLLPTKHTSEQPVAQIGSRFLSNASSEWMKSTRNICDVMVHRLNPGFTQNVELGLRCGFALALLNIPAMYGMSADYHVRSVIKTSQVLSASSLVTLVYIVFKSVGETICCAWSGILGALLGNLFPWVMFGLAPRGVLVLHPVDPAFWFGIVMGSLFVSLVMFLNVSILTKIFTLSSFVGHWMAFMDPHGGSDHSNAFSVKLDGPMFKGLFGGTSGCTLAVVCTLLPYPIWATTKARTCANNVVAATTRTWKASLAFYSMESRDRYAMAEVFHCKDEMNAEMHTLQGHIDNCWWECFGFSYMVRMRKMLQKLEDISQESCFRLNSTINACSSEDWSGMHNTLMRRCGPKLQKVVERSHDLFAELVEFANQGKLPGEVDRRNLVQSKAVLQQDLAELADDFRRVKAEVDLPELSVDLLEEHSFCFSVSNFGRLALEYYDFVCDPDFETNNATDHPILTGLKEGFGDVFNSAVLFSKENVNFAMKNTLSILICFYIGLVGYSQLLPRFSAGIASTASILLSKFAGSAIKNNLTRLQGVVIGLILGELGYSLFGGCEPWQKVTRSCMLVGYVSSTLFFYFSRSAYAGITLLMAAFGTEFFTKPCADDRLDQTETMLASFHSVVEVVICIVVMGVVDCTCALGRPSILAHSTIREAWDAIHEQVRNLLDPTTQYVRQGHGDLRRRIDLAEFLGIEAADEPRLWRSPWRSRVFTQMVECARSVRTDLSNMEYSASDDANDDGQRMKNEILVGALKMDQFVRLGSLVHQRLDRIYRMLDIMAMDEGSALEDINEKWDSSHDKADFDKALEGSICELNGKFKVQLDQGGGSTLDEDISCRLSIIFLSLVGMRRHIRVCEEALIRG